MSLNLLCKLSYMSDLLQLCNNFNFYEIKYIIVKRIVSVMYFNIGRIRLLSNFFNKFRTIIINKFNSKFFLYDK